MTEINSNNVVRRVTHTKKDGTIVIYEYTHDDPKTYYKEKFEIHSRAIGLKKRFQPTDEQIKEMKSLLQSMPKTQIAKKYGICTKTLEKYIYKQV